MDLIFTTADVQNELNINLAEMGYQNITKILETAQNDIVRLINKHSRVHNYANIVFADSENLEVLKRCCLLQLEYNIDNANQRKLAGIIQSYRGTEKYSIAERQLILYSPIVVEELTNAGLLYSGGSCEIDRGEIWNY